MKIRKFIIIVLIIVMIFLIWQIILIINALKEVFLGIDFTRLINNQTNNQTNIPRIIHQMWKTKDLSTYPIENSHLKWKIIYPNYEIRLWTDEDLKELLKTTEYNYLEKIYQSLDYSIERADLGRLMIIHHQGGIYVDLDVFPNDRSIEELRLYNRSLIIPRSFSGSTLINHIIIGEKSSSILHFILHQIKQKRFYKKIYLFPYLEVFSRGSFFLTKTIKNYLKLSNENHKHIWILSEKELDKYITHQIGRSWHLFDGFIFNQIDAQRKLSFIIFSSIIIIIIYFIWKSLKKNSIIQREL